MSLGGSLNDCTPPIPDTRNKSPILFILFFILFKNKNKKSRDNGLLLRKKKNSDRGQNDSADDSFVVPKEGGVVPISVLLFHFCFPVNIN